MSGSYNNMYELIILHIFLAIVILSTTANLLVDILLMFRRTKITESND